VAYDNLQSKYGRSRGKLHAMIRSTTVVAVRRDGKTAIAADGQVTFGEATILKHKAKKVRRLSSGKVVCGFAGSVADAQALQDKFEAKLESFQSNLRRAAVEFAKEWRTDKILRELNAMMIVADKDGLLLVGGDGNVIEPDDGVAGIGSGGPYALAAARALLLHTDMNSETIVREALRIASEICVFTNNEITVEVV
jgi:ATP-dependent HslUV protease subunit HslV